MSHQELRPRQQAQGPLVIQRATPYGVVGDPVDRSGADGNRPRRLLKPGKLVDHPKPLAGGGVEPEQDDSQFDDLISGGTEPCRLPIDERRQPLVRGHAGRGIALGHLGHLLPLLGSWSGFQNQNTPLFRAARAASWLARRARVWRLGRRGSSPQARMRRGGRTCPPAGALERTAGPELSPSGHHRPTFRTRTPGPEKVDTRLPPGMREGSRMRGGIHPADGILSRRTGLRGPPIRGKLVVNVAGPRGARADRPGGVEQRRGRHPRLEA